MECASFLLQEPPTPGGVAAAPHAASARARGDDHVVAAAAADAADECATDAPAAPSPPPALSEGTADAVDSPRAAGEAAAARPVRARKRILLDGADEEEQHSDGSPSYEPQSGAGPKKYRGVWCAAQLRCAAALRVRAPRLHQERDAPAPAAATAPDALLRRCARARRLDKKRNKCAPTCRVRARGGAAGAHARASSHRSRMLPCSRARARAPPPARALTRARAPRAGSRRASVRGGATAALLALRLAGPGEQPTLTPLPWRAAGVSGRTLFLGSHTSEDEAARACAPRCAACARACTARNNPCL
jgi:hypothetical protein